MRKTTTLIALLLLCAAAAPAIDVRVKEEQLDRKALAFPQLKPNLDANRVAQFLTNPAWSSWNQAHGGNWTAQFDTLTGVARRVYGGSIPWNAKSVSNAQLEAIARNFIATNGTLLGVTNDKLRFIDAAAAASRDGRIRYAAFDYVINGVPVENARLIFAVNNGNLIYWHSANVAASPAVTSPAISAPQAFANALAYAGVSSTDASAVKLPALKLLPRNRAAGELVAYQLVYETAFRLAGGRATWAAWIDAATGAVVAFGDTNKYAACETRNTTTGKVTGGIRPAQATDAEVVRSFPSVAIDNNGAQTTSANGNFVFSGGTASTGLNGTFFDTVCSDCRKSESDPQPGFQPFASSTSGRIALGTGGRDVVNGTTVPTVSYGNGTSTPADRTAFFHTNVARGIARKWMDLPWLDTKIDVNVNINDVCNAFWNGTSLNFFKAGELAPLTGTNNLQCKNTGEIRDVMQHEWGHGLDDNDGIPPGYALGLGDMATGEAVADHIALFVDRDSCIGQSFYNRFSGPFVTNPDTMALATCDGVRNVDELRANRGTLTSSNVTAECTINPTAPYYIGPLLGEGHCEGELWGQVGWHLMHNLMTGRSYGSATLDANKQHFTSLGSELPAGNGALDRDAAWTLFERLFFASRPMMASYAPSHMQAMGAGAYDAWLVADDEGDGLANGTPHAAYINDAYSHHGITEVTTTADAPNCAAPATPNSTLAQGVTNGSPSVTISWTPVANAESYSVQRTERRHDVWLDVARITGGNVFSVTDAGVDNGVTYHYRVQANGAGACFATSGGGVRAITIAQGDLEVRGTTIVDNSGGNGDGILDAGEKANLYIALGNIGLAGLTNVSATILSNTPGVTITQAGPRSYGSIGAGGQAGPSRSFQIQVDRNGGLCGTSAAIVVNVSSDQGCFAVPMTLAISAAGSECYVHRTAYARPASVAITNDRLNATCGDGDNWADPGETVEVSVAVDNRGERRADDVRVVLSANQPYLNVLTQSVSLGSINGLGAETKTAKFQVSVARTAPVDAEVTLTATVTSSNSSTTTGTLVTRVNRNVARRTVNYDFETGDQGWTSSSAAGWQRKNLQVTTGNLTYVWHSGYHQFQCDTLTSPRLEITSTSRIAFDLAYIAETTDAPYDGVDVQVSTDGGASWQTLELTQSYPALSAGTGCIPKLAPFFSGISPLMARYDADLSAYAGRTVQLRFRFSADELVDAPAGGAWLDNVSASDVVVATPSIPCL